MDAGFTQDLGAEPAEPARPLWDGWIDRGEVTILGGDPGTYKGQLGAFIAASVTRGADGFHGGSVVIVSAEDHVRRVLRPRLEVAGADFVNRNVRFRSGDLLLTGRGAPEYLASLADASAAYAAKLLVIDPLEAFTTRMDRLGMRQAISALDAIACALDLAVLVIHHLRKGSGRRSMNDLAGGGGHVAAARRVLMMQPYVRPIGQGPQEEDKDRAVVSVVKANNAPKNQCLLVQSEVVPVPSRPDVTAARLNVLGLLEETLVEERESPLVVAERFLAEFLADGPRYQGDVHEAANLRGITDATLRRAREALGVVPFKGERGRSYWRLPTVPDSIPPEWS